MGPRWSARSHELRDLLARNNVSHRFSVTGIHGQGRLEAISVRDSATGREQTEPADGLFVLIGADPHSDWLADIVERLEGLPP